MPVLDQGRKYVSEVVAGTGVIEEVNGVDYFYAQVDVKEGQTAGEVVSPVGLPLVYSAGDSAFIPYKDEDIALVTTSSLPNESPVCIAVGAKEGIGFNKEDITLSGTAVVMTVLFRGSASVIHEGIDYDVSHAASEPAFEVQLEKQNIAVQTQAEEVIPSFTEYTGAA